MPVLLLLGIALLGLVAVGQIRGEGMWAAELQDFAHGPVFAFLALIVIALLRRVAAGYFSAFWDYVLTFAIVLLLGALLELLQLVTGRDVSSADLFRDALGALAALGFFSLVDPRLRAMQNPGSVRLAGVLLGVISTALIVAPLAISGAAYLQRQRSLPTLVDFNSPLSRYFLRAYSAVVVERRPVPDDLRNGTDRIVGLHARTIGNQGWGLALWEPYPDWSSFDWLALDLTNPTDDLLVLQVHIRDRRQKHDRQSGYLAQIEVAQHSRETRRIELRELTAAEGRARVDIAIVDSIVFTPNPANRAPEFYLLRIWLE